MLNRVKRGEADWGHTVAGIYFDPSLALVSTYGVNGSQFFVRPGLTLRMLAFNSSRPLFRDNPRLRRAVNYALGRRALQFAGPLSSELTDQYLPSTLPGSEDANIYPLDRPDVEKARELAAGNTRGGKAVIYTTDFSLPLAAAQLVKRQLAEIGLELEVKALPIHIATAAYVGKLAVQGEPWDLALVLWTPELRRPVRVSQRPARPPVHRRHESGALRVGRLRPAAAPGRARARGGRPPVARTARSTCGSPAARRRSPRSTCSAR